MAPYQLLCLQRKLTDTIIPFSRMEMIEPCLNENLPLNVDHTKYII